MKRSSSHPPTSIRARGDPDKPKRSSTSTALVDIGLSRIGLDFVLSPWWPHVAKRSARLATALPAVSRADVDFGPRTRRRDWCRSARFWVRCRRLGGGGVLVFWVWVRSRSNSHIHKNGFFVSELEFDGAECLHLTDRICWPFQEATALALAAAGAVASQQLVQNLLSACRRVRAFGKRARAPWTDHSSCRRMFPLQESSIGAETTLGLERCHAPQPGSSLR